MKKESTSPYDDPCQLARVTAAVDGYTELGIYDMAWQELRSMPVAFRAHPDVQEAELCLLMREERWNDAIATGQMLCHATPEKRLAFIHTAYALHELHRTAEARLLLSSGPPALHDDPLFHYNMACYHAVMGDLQDAEVRLRQAFSIDSKLREFARQDPDLVSFREII